MLTKYDSYKNSISPISRKIPTHWKEKRLSHIFQFKSIQNNENEALLSVFLNRGVVSYFSTNQKQVHKPSEDLSKYQLVEFGDFVLNNQQAWRGSVGVSKFRGIISPAYYVLKPKIKINFDFLNYMCRDKDVVDQFVLSSKGVGSIQRQIYVPYLKSTVFALPTLNEQNQIVRFLDWKTAQMDYFIKQKRREIENLEDLKNSIIVDAVTKGISRRVNCKISTIQWIKKIPVKWKEIMLFQCTSEQNISNKDIHHQNLLSVNCKCKLNTNLIKKHYQ